VEQIRVVVVDDSPFMRTLITSVLEQAGIAVVAQAGDGAEALAAVRTHRPQVVTMDLHMPNVGGVEATRRIMEEVPTQILILSAYADGSADETLDALDAGAADFFAKPGGELTTGIPTVKAELVERIAALATAAATRPEATPRAATERDASPAAATVDARAVPDNATVVLGASTGGPAVVERFLTDLPIEAGFRVLVVQHMPPGFTRRFAERLDGKSDYRVREATDGAVCRRGEVLVAPGGSHMEVVGDREGVIQVHLTDDPVVHGVRPAVDVTMWTAAQEVQAPLVAVVCTGMGADGAAGVEAMKDAGARVLVQDEATSAVYGMPARAVHTGCVDEEVPGDRLAERVVASFAESEEVGRGR
jgi:two-component system chemotaxis response regulator CheB